MCENVNYMQISDTTDSGIAVSDQIVPIIVTHSSYLPLNPSCAIYSCSVAAQNTFQNLSGQGFYEYPWWFFFPAYSGDIGVYPAGYLFNYTIPLNKELSTFECEIKVLMERNSLAKGLRAHVRACVCTWSLSRMCMPVGPCLYTWWIVPSGRLHTHAILRISSAAVSSSRYRAWYTTQKETRKEVLNLC